MKNVVGLFLLSIYLLFATDIKELLKVNKLVLHYYETKEINKSISFFHFLEMHYITDDANSKDNDQDKKLPFKSPDSLTASGAFVYSSEHFSTLTFQFFPTKILDFGVTTDFIASSNFPNLVWHPPQFT